MTYFWSVLLSSGLNVMADRDAAPPYLCDQDVCHSVDGVVLVAVGDEALSPPLFEARQELCVKVQEVLQSGEQAVQSARVHLEVLFQLSDVHVQHYLQCSNVVHLCLHQLCRTVQRNISETRKDK